MWYANPSSQSTACLLILFSEFFIEHKILILMRLNFSFYVLCFGVKWKNSLPGPGSEDFPVFFFFLKVLWFYVFINVHNPFMFIFV